MNREIHNKELTTRSDNGTKNHQAYAMEVSRLEKAKAMCVENSDCVEFNRLGGESRLMEVKPLVDKEREINYSKKKTGMDTGRQNQFQDPLDPTEVKAAKVTRDADHSGKSVTNKIMSKKTDILTNKEALSEEISNIRYLIEYMNNNNKKQII